MDTVSLILLVAGLILFLIAAFYVATARVNLVALGLACWIGSAIIESPLVKK